MRKALLMILALAAAAATLALAPTPKAQADTVCYWTCGPCGLVCPCDKCKGPIPFCQCA